MSDYGHSHSSKPAMETGVDRALRSLCGWPAYKPGESKPPAESQEAAAPSPTRLAPEDHSTFLSATLGLELGVLASVCSAPL